MKKFRAMAVNFAVFIKMSFITYNVEYKVDVIKNYIQ